MQYTDINSKWVKNLKVRPEIMIHLEENIGGKLFDTGLGEFCFVFVFVLI